MPTPPSESPEHWGIDGLALGISLGGPAHRDDWERMLRWAELADGLGLHSVWVPEHVEPYDLRPRASTSSTGCRGSTVPRAS